MSGEKMHIDMYEKFWMWAAALIVAVFIASIFFTTFAQSRMPPSHVETIDPRAVRQNPDFASPGVTINSDGTATVHVLAQMFAFAPNEIRVPRGRKVTFRITSPDVIHGFQIVMTNGNAMVVPGYVTQFSTQFDDAGEYLIVCNEYCGLGHHIMFGTLIVEDGVSAVDAEGSEVAAAGETDHVPSFPEKAELVTAGGQGGDR
jgi:cytochrome c oxidase subunit 2